MRHHRMKILKKKTILITGAGGFVGRHLLQKLQDRYSIRALVYKKDQFLFQLTSNITVIEADLLHPHRKLQESFRGVDIVLHFAGSPFNTNNLRGLFENNVLMTENVLRLCVATGVKKFILASSSAVYGAAGKPFRENDPLFPTSYYGLSKLYAEALCQLYDTVYGVKSIILRFASIYGPWNQKGLFFDLLKSISQEKKVIIRDGAQKRNSIEIDDVMRLIKKILRSTFLRTQIYNVSGPDSFSVNDVVRSLKEMMHEKFFVEYRSGSTLSHTLLNIEKVKRDFRWSPIIKLKVGLKKVADYF